MQDCNNTDPRKRAAVWVGEWVEFDSARRMARIPERRLDKAQLIHSSLPLTSILFVHITKMRPSMQLNAGGMPGRKWFFRARI